MGKRSLNFLRPTTARIAFARRQNSTSPPPINHAPSSGSFGRLGVVCGHGHTSTPF